MIGGRRAGMIGGIGRRWGYVGDCFSVRSNARRLGDLTVEGLRALWRLVARGGALGVERSSSWRSCSWSRRRSRVRARNRDGCGWSGDGRRFEGAMVGEADFGGAFQFVDGFIRFAADGIDFGGGVDHVMEMDARCLLRWRLYQRVLRRV